MTTTKTAGSEALRIGFGSAVVLVWTDDKALAQQTALDWAANCPALAGKTARVSRTTARANRYHTLGYEGPAVTVSLDLRKK